MSKLLIDVLWQSWLVLGEMAPYLLFGFAAAGLLSVMVSPEWTQRHLGGRGIGPVLKAALWGIPLPLCSCSVIPVVASMRRHGASRAAATSFLLSTPQTGVDSIAVTYALLGPVFAVVRPIAALASGLFGGLLVLLLGEPSGAGADDEPDLPACTDPCCTGDRSERAVIRALRHGVLSLPRDLAGALVVGVLIAGAMAALMSPRQLAGYLGGGLGSILLLMAAGIPLYVCATASVPIAAGLMHLGASPGAAMAFLMAGPATNAATFTTIWKVLGRRTALLYLATVAAASVVCGLVLDLLVPWVGAWIPNAGPLAAHGEPDLAWSSFWAVALLAVLAFSYVGSRRRPAAELRQPDAGPACACHAASAETPVSKPHCHEVP